VLVKLVEVVVVKTKRADWSQYLVKNQVLLVFAVCCVSTFLVLG
jgi:hypothetical protein